MIYQSNPDTIKRAADLIRSGHLVVFPTETVYGLGADAFNTDAVQKIFVLKKRPNFNPLIVHLYDVSELDLVVDFARAPELREIAAKLKRFWPGPISLVLPKKPALPDCVTAGLDSVAVRIPSHPVARQFLKECGVPVAAPSANLFSEVSPTSARHAAESLGDRVDFILDGGACRVGLESTVLSLIHSPPRLLRPGAVTLEQLRGALGEVSAPCAVLENALQPRSPGMLKKHYSPNTPLAFKGEMARTAYPEKVGLISFNSLEDPEDTFGYAAVNCVSSRGDLEEAAANLFAAIRELDKLELDLILVDTCPSEGIGLAIMDRLRRASQQNEQ